MNDINAPVPQFGIEIAVRLLKAGKPVKERGSREGICYMLSKANDHGEQILMRHDVTWERRDHIYARSVLWGYWELAEGEWEQPDYPYP